MEIGPVVSGSSAQPFATRFVEPVARVSDSYVPIGLSASVIVRQAGLELCVPYRVFRPVAQTVWLPDFSGTSSRKLCPSCVLPVPLAVTVLTACPSAVLATEIGEVV